MFNLRPHLRRPTAPLTLALMLCCASPALAAQEAPPARGSATSELQVPAELFPVTRVVDGDTIYVERAGQVEKLRLLSVDTEEKLTGNSNLGPNKPETVFGEECALWAAEFFEARATEEGPARVGLRFPGGVEARDIYGRLLCHVILDDGTDFNLLLVQKGKSPYFNKYGNSRICHADFVAAQRAAQAEKLGIWNPATNAAATPGAPAAKRPYAKLMPWWQARADAIDAFRTASAADPAGHVDSEDPVGLAAAVKLGEPVRVFGSPYQLFDEQDGSLTVLFRAPDRDQPLRGRISKARRPAFEAHGIERTTEEFHQNYVWVTGVVTNAAPDARPGFDLVLDDPQQWALAGPEPRVLELMPAAHR